MKSYYSGELSWRSIEVLIFIAEIQSEKLGGILLSKHGITLVRLTVEEVHQLDMSSVLQM